MTRQDLKRCPFCGGIANLWQTNYQSYIQCENYDATTHGRHLIQVSADTEDEVIKKWNRRI